MNARSVAVKVLSEIERDGSYSNIASDAAIQAAGLSRQDAALASFLIYGVLQRKLTLDFVLKSFTDKGFNKIHPFVLSVLRVAAYQLLFADKIPVSAAINEAVKIVKNSKQRFAAGFCNAVLRKVANNREELLEKISQSSDPEVKYSCPKELYSGLKNDYSLEFAENFLSESLLSPKTYAAVNLLKTNYETLSSLLEEKGIVCEKDNDTKTAFSIKNAGSVENLQEFKNGLFFIQDKASQITIGNLDLYDGARVLDVCAAPGGKSFTAASLLKNGGEIVSCDIYEARVGLIKNGAKRLGFSNIKPMVNDAAVYNSEFGKFDRVICDVPCSGVGVIRRKPEIKYKKISDYADLPEIQLNILSASVKYLKEDGLLIYSTCTVRKAENEDVVSHFISENDEFEVIKSQTLSPKIDGTDGFFYSVLKRKEYVKN